MGPDRPKKAPKWAQEGHQDLARPKKTVFAKMSSLARWRSGEVIPIINSNGPHLISLFENDNDGRFFNSLSESSWLPNY